MSINSFFNQALQIKNRTGKDLHGKQSYGAARDTAGRFEKRRSTIATANREREPIDGVAFLKPDEAAEVGDVVIYHGDTYKIMTKDEIVTGNGKVHHLEVKVQTWLES